MGRDPLLPALCRLGWHRWRYHTDPDRRRCVGCLRHQVRFFGEWVNS